jgi:hypothetical protein
VDWEEHWWIDNLKLFLTRNAFELGIRSEAFEKATNGIRILYSSTRRTRNRQEKSMFDVFSGSSDSSIDYSDRLHFESRQTSSLIAACILCTCSSVSAKPSLLLAFILLSSHQLPLSPPPHTRVYFKKIVFWRNSSRGNEKYKQQSAKRNNKYSPRFSAE